VADHQGSPARVGGKLFREVEIDGTKYVLSQPQRVGSFGDQEALIISRRLDPIVFGMRVCERLPANRHSACWEGCAAAASRGIASQEEWASYEGSMWKPAYLLWAALDPKHKLRPDGKTPMTLADGVAWTVELVDAMTNEKFREIMREVSLVGQDESIKNSDGPTETSGQAPSQ
jgi:hypothetical protein